MPSLLLWQATHMVDACAYPFQALNSVTLLFVPQDWCPPYPKELLTSDASFTALQFPLHGYPPHTAQALTLHTGPLFCNVYSGFLTLVVQSLSHVQLFVTPWTAACQASLSFANSLSLLKLMSIESEMPPNHLFLCCPLLLPSLFPSIRVFSNE